MMVQRLGMLALLLILYLLVSPRDVTCLIEGADFLNYDCTTNNYTFISGSTFQASLNYTLFTILPSNASLVSFSNFSTGQGPDMLYALFLCRGNIDLQECHDCVQVAAKNIVQKCSHQKEAIVWYEQCMLRYANRSLFSKEELTPSHQPFNSSSILSSFYLDQYDSIFQSTIDGLINQAAHNTSRRGFATIQIPLSSEQTLQGSVQCTPDILGDRCEHCLTAALKQRNSWSNNNILLPSCFIRYDIYGSPFQSPPTSAVPGKVNVIKIVLPCVSGFLLLLLGCYWFYKKHCCACEQEDPLSPERMIAERPGGLAQFSFSELENMTGGFLTKLGEGGFGIVYLGRLTTDAGSMDVAVKVLSNDAPRQFSNEIEVFAKISHKNLVSLVGYCQDGTNLALIYEYMVKGDLKAFLSGSDSSSWKKRLEIAIDSAQGLDYLHNGCRPPIIHRDVKTPNILLNQDLRAKIADFGFSKIFPDEYVTSVLSSRVIGSPGYLDPQYYLTGQLTEKSDVYSFGVVLLELITGKGAIVSQETTLVHWVKPMLERGDLENIVDPKLHQVQRRNSIWRAIDLAMQCVTYTALERPTMSGIAIDLRECLAMEINATSSAAGSDSTEMMTALVSFSTMSPAAR